MNQGLCIYLTNLYYNSVGYYILMSSVWHTKLIESDELSFWIHTVGLIRSTLFCTLLITTKGTFHRYLGICCRELSEDAQEREREQNLQKRTEADTPGSAKCSGS